MQISASDPGRGPHIPWTGADYEETMESKHSTYSNPDGFHWEQSLVCVRFR
jgi:hypothetical protein